MRGRSAVPDGPIDLGDGLGREPSSLARARRQPGLLSRRIELTYRGAGGVYVRGLSGGQPRLLERHGYQPVWSPHGVIIAFKRQTSNCDDAGCHERIWIVRSSGGAATVLEPEFFDSGSLTWTSAAPPKKTVSINVPY